ncbi:outer membrane beta-barrel protein [Magnetospirillum sp. 15-1]|uniref:outer membrane beta-barrel protein n=1 Tax=Magnetospirillum sp. 15-1 TaxID=1979370 RepID=UPI00114174EF|nr:outer membrane beta-barrel protein [Magnetospirillum sp. 15-1]
MNYTYGASLRGGYRITNTAMLYGRVGAVRSGVEYKSNRGRHSEEELWGLRMGVGMEIAMTEKVMVRGEYGLRAPPPVPWALGTPRRAACEHGRAAQALLIRVRGGKTYTV